VVVRDDDTEVLNGRLFELVLLWPEEEPTEHLPDNLPVTGKVGVHNVDVIEVDHDLGVGKAEVHH
jgi:hypothetical protein